MKDQLQKDVASWREGRSEGSSRGATELSVAVARSIVPPTNARMKRAKPAASETKPATSAKEAVRHVLRRHQPVGLHQADDRSRGQVSWVTFEAATGGLVTVQLRHIVAIYDEQGSVKLATTAGGVHVLKDITVQRAAGIVSNAEDATRHRSDQ